MSKASWVFNLDNDPRGIARVLGPGLATRVFPGRQRSWGRCQQSAVREAGFDLISGYP